MDYVIALVPPVGLLIARVVSLRAVLGADRSERAAEKAFREAHPDLDLAPLPPSRSSVAGAHQAAAQDRPAQGEPDDEAPAAQDATPQDAAAQDAGASEARRPAATDRE